MQRMPKARPRRLSRRCAKGPSSRLFTRLTGCLKVGAGGKSSFGKRANCGKRASGGKRASSGKGCYCGPMPWRGRQWRICGRKKSRRPYRGRRRPNGSRDLDCGRGREQNPRGVGRRGCATMGSPEYPCDRFASADIPPARCLAPVNDAPASAVVRRGLASMLVEVSQPKNHYFVSVTFPIR